MSPLFLFDGLLRFIYLCAALPATLNPSMYFRSHEPIRQRGVMSQSSVTRSTESRFTCLEPQSNRSKHKTNGAMVHSSSSVSQLLMYDVITSLANNVPSQWSVNKQCRCNNAIACTNTGACSGVVGECYPPPPDLPHSSWWTNTTLRTRKRGCERALQE